MKRATYYPTATAIVKQHMLRQRAARADYFEQLCAMQALELADREVHVTVHHVHHYEQPIRTVHPTVEPAQAKPGKEKPGMWRGFLNLPRLLGSK